MGEGDKGTKGINVRMKDTRFCTNHGPCAIYNAKRKEVKNTTGRKNLSRARARSTCEADTVRARWPSDSMLVTV